MPPVTGEPDLTGMRGRPTRVVGAAVGALLVAGVAGLVAAVNSSRATPPAGLLPTGAKGPTGVATVNFSPTGLGVAVTPPASWRREPPASGFQYVMVSPGTTGRFFLLELRESSFIPLSASRLAQAGIRFLRSVGATISSDATDLVDGRPAVRLRYIIRSGQNAAADTEYDILTTGSLPVGSRQRQTEYSYLIVVLGAPVGTPTGSLLDWIASTIRIVS